MKNFPKIKAMLVLALLGGVLSLWAALGDKSGKQETDTDLLQTIEFWQDTMQWKDAVGINANTANPWYMKEGTGFPVQHEDQKNFASSDGVITIGESKIFSNESEFLDIFEADQPLIGEEGKINFGEHDMTLEGDIDLNWATIKSISEFKGTLDGNGYKICNFKIEGKGFIENLEGTVQNLVIENAEVIYDGDTVGIVAAEVCNGGSIQNCLIKDCHITGGRYLGMFAGSIKDGTSASSSNCGKVQKCLVVNGTITSNIGDDPDVLITDAHVGGAVGYIGVYAYFTNIVTMLDMFKLNYKPAKNGTLGRVSGNRSGMEYLDLYGWVETGFTRWNNDIGNYYWVYYPYWDNNSTYTGDVDDVQEHGENLFVGDYNLAALSFSDNKSNTTTFWANKADFDLTTDWTFTEGDQYPVPTCAGGVSSVATNGLITRRGFEADMSGFTSGATESIHTGLGLVNAKGKSAGGGSDFTLSLYTDMEFSKSGTASIWQIDQGFTAGCFIYTLNTNFDGKGHELDGINISGNRYSQGFVSNSYASNFSRLALTNYYLNVTNSSSGAVGGLIGYAVSSGLNISNCYMEIDLVQVYNSLTTYSSVHTGGLIGGFKNKTGVVEKNIMKITKVRGYGYSQGGALVASISGANNANASIEKNTVLRNGTGQIQIISSGGGYVQTNQLGKDLQSLNNYYKSSSDFSLSSTSQTFTNQGTVITGTMENHWKNTIGLDENIWHIFADDDKLPLLKKEQFDWDAELGN